MILEVRQHLQQEDDGSVHMRRKAPRAVNLVDWDSPDSLVTEREVSRKISNRKIFRKTYEFSRDIGTVDGRTDETLKIKD